MPKWTKEQQDAINLEGENIIVSAGAGSGKTAVLTERVIRKLESGVSINRLLILTFTKLAANEMKTRIRNEIKKRIELSDELKKIDSSFITTFDSFSLSLVKKYHYLLNVKKSINIIDSNILNIKTKEYLDEIMEDEYQIKNPNFIKLISDFCIKDDGEIKDLILSVNNKLDLKYDKDEYLKNYLKEYYNDSFISESINNYFEYLKSIITSMDNDLSEISHEVDIDYYNKLSDLIVPIISSTDYDSIKNNVYRITKLPILPRGSSEEAKKIKEKINSKLKKLKELTRFSNRETLYNSIMLTKPYLEAIIKIIKELDDKIKEYKFQNDLYDFSDICKMAIKLVMDNNEIRNEIKAFFNEIMVDEYQDTSDLQEKFISLISNNNVYVVGDVKQSIYRFRNANPNIFRHKYNLYATGIDGKKIDLLKNFRSRSEVLDNINLMFNYVMSELLGGANYIKDHQMIFGNTSYNLDGKTNQNNNLEIYSYEYDKEIGFSKDEIEAFIIANDIINKVNNHYQVYDKKDGKLRDATYNDFAILMDRSSSFMLYKKIFLYKKIPLNVYQDEYLTNSDLFLVIRNIFKLINIVYEKDYSKNMEYAYLSIARSFLFKVNDNAIFDIIRNRNYENTEIFIKVKEIINNIESKSITNILDEIIEKFNFYEKLRTIPNLETNYIKIEYLYNLASNLNEMGYTFKDFDSFLENIMNNKTEIKFSMNKEDGDGVKLMTIHASKGLEFPLCYFPGLYKDFNTGDIKSRIIFNNLLGIITPYYDEGMDNTFYRDLLINEYCHDEISEKIRLFYVALTRVREKMIFIVPNEEMEEKYVNNLVDDEIRINYRSFSDIIYSIKSKLLDFFKDISLDKIELTKKYNLINSNNMFNNINMINEKIKIMDIPKVIINKIEDSHFSKSSSKVFSKEEKEKMEFGSKIHYYLETIDFLNPDLSSIVSPYKEKIEALLESDLLKEIKKARVYQEYEFIETNDREEKHGIIDLMLEYSDHIDIIDYKLKNILDEAYIKQLNGYKDYIQSITNKKVNTYLYSIMDSIYQKI